MRIPWAIWIYRDVNSAKTFHDANSLINFFHNANLAGDFLISIARVALQCEFHKQFGLIYPAMILSRNEFISIGRVALRCEFCKQFGLIYPAMNSFGLSCL